MCSILFNLKLVGSPVSCVCQSIVYPVSPGEVSDILIRESDRTFRNVCVILRLRAWHSVLYSAGSPDPFRLSIHIRAHPSRVAAIDLRAYIPPCKHSRRSVEAWLTERVTCSHIGPAGEVIRVNCNGGEILG
jgi:hypothetical protein